MRKVALLTVLAVLIAPVLASASRVTEQAEYAVRDIIKSSTGYSRIYFSLSKENFLSPSEARVTGEGVASNRNGWGGVPFKYSVKVHRSNYNTRDASIDFAEGNDLNSNSDWSKPLHSQGYEVGFTYPRWYQTVTNSSVRFEGKSYGSGEIQVQVYDRNGRLVREGRGNPDRNGTWAVQLDLSSGSYRAVAHRRGWNNGDEVRFAVERRSGDWGEGSVWDDGNGSFAWQQGGWDRPTIGGSGDLEITNPRSGDSVNAGSFRFRGRSNGEEVTFSLFRGDNRISRRTLRVRNGEWENTIFVGEGRYRLVIERDGRSREVQFSVRDGDFSGSSNIEITNPRNGDRVSSGSFRFRGRSDGREVTFTLFRGDSRVTNRTLSVYNGEWDNTVFVSEGRYRLVVERDGRSREVNFTVGSGSNIPSGSIEITNPRNGERVSSGSFRFRGRSDGREVTFSLFQGNSRVTNRTLSVRNGEWEFTTTLNSGSYRVVVERDGRSREVRFTADGGSSGGSSGGAVLRVTNPREGDSVSNGSIRFRGEGPDGEVTFRLYQGDRQITRRLVRVRNGQWETTYSLDSGRYRLIVESRTDTREIAFNVR
jgi:hypothetical protein